MNDVTVTEGISGDIGAVFVVNLSVLSHFFFSSRRRHTRCSRDWSSDVCSSDLTRGSSRIHRREMLETLRPVRLLRRSSASKRLCFCGLPSCEKYGLWVRVSLA